MDDGLRHVPGLCGCVSGVSNPLRSRSLNGARSRRAYAILRLLQRGSCWHVMRANTWRGRSWRCARVPGRPSPFVLAVRRTMEVRCDGYHHARESDASCADGVSQGVERLLFLRCAFVERRIGFRRWASCVFTSTVGPNDVRSHVGIEIARRHHQGCCQVFGGRLPSRHDSSGCWDWESP